jgi:phage baseplate assembly protein V
MNAREVFELVGPMKNRLRGLVKVGTVKLAKETTKLRELQLRIDQRETPDDYPHYEPYGMTARPKAGAEAVVLNVNGDRSVPLVLCVADRRFRIELEEGEVAIYDDQGAYLKLSRSGIVVEPASTQTVELGSGATQGVARIGDEVEVDSTTDPAFIAWISNVSGFINGLAPGTIPSIPTTVTGEVSEGSATIKAVD